MRAADRDRRSRGALAAQAALIVSGDTGPLHIAAAVGTPVVALFGPTNPRRNGPWAPDDVTVSRFDGVRVPLRAAVPRGRRGVSRASAWPRSPRRFSSGSAAALAGAAGVMSELVAAPGALSRPTRVRRAVARVVAGAADARGAWPSGAAIAVVGEGAAHLGRRPSREGPRGHGVGSVSPDAASAVCRLGAHRRSGLPIASASVSAAVAGRRVPGADDGAAIRSEEAHLTEKFGAAYPEYRDGRATGAIAASASRGWCRNREYRAVVGPGPGACAARVEGSIIVSLGAACFPGGRPGSARAADEGG